MTNNHIPVAKPLLPKAEDLLPLLKEIDQNRIYSNFGPLNERLQSLLAKYYNLPPGCVTIVASGTTGLTLALMASNTQPGGYCLMPSWTFVATAHAALAAGLVPYFLDVDEHTWSLNPDEVANVLRRLKPQVAAVMPVFPFGRPLDLSDWDALSADYGVPIVIDAAAGFDSLVPGDSPAVVSLHATKVIGIGEGGFVISRRPDLIAAIQLRANFGFHGRREATVASLNGKLSEYNAAVGLLSLEEWPKTRMEFMSSIGRYRHHAAQYGRFHLQPGFGEQWVSTNCTVRLAEGSASACMERLHSMGIDSRAWYGEGLHVQPAFRNNPREGNLPVTQALSRQTIGLPLFRGISTTAIDQVVSGC